MRERDRVAVWAHDGGNIFGISKFENAYCGPENNIKPSVMDTNKNTHPKYKTY